MYETPSGEKPDRDVEALKLTSLETIAATIAHEIKNPLALIKANIDFIELCDTEKKYIKNYAVMKKEIDRANELLIDFNKLLHKGFCMDDIINVRAAVEKTIEDYAQYDSIKIRSVCTGDEEPVIKGNRDLFLMALSNVMKNAVESMDAVGEITVGIEKNCGRVKITVTDKGCGIGIDALEKLNSDISVTSKIYGNGLGLSLTKKIVAGHGGTFEIRNNSDVGVSAEMSFGEYLRQ